MDTTASRSMINPTGIASHFNSSPQKVNLILSELGFIENDIAGWKLTRLGKENGGKQCQHDVSGKLYVLWPSTIVSNKNLVGAFNGVAPNNIERATTQEHQLHSDNFRFKYPANYRTRDGHYVRSKSEVIIDDWLYTYGLVHSYERKLPISDDVISDFYIPAGSGRPQAVFIEFWGMENEPQYKERMNKKIAIYKKNELPLIELYEADIQNIDDVLPRKLLAFKIKVG
jgi:hypothetical protein